MDGHVAMGVFAIYSMLVTLVRLLHQVDVPRCTMMKRAWGRSRGLVVYFITDVAIPFMFGIIFLARGLASLPL